MAMATETMPVCESSAVVGETYRYEWRQDDGGATFGSTGELLEVAPPYRAVTSERMYGDGIPDDAPATRNELTLTPTDGGTLLSVVITYPDARTRDLVLGTGMVGGMETSYARLEQQVLAAV